MRRLLRILFGCILAAYLLSGCAARHRAPAVEQIAIPESPVFLLSLESRQLMVMDQRRREVVSQLPLDQMPMDYVFSPDRQQLIMSLHDDPNDSTSHVGVLDLSTGRFSKIPVPLGSLDLVHVTVDGTIYVDSGSSEGDSFKIAVLGTHPYALKRIIKVPGMPTRITSLSNGQVLIPVRGLENDSNIYTIDPASQLPVPLLSDTLLPTAPGQLLVDEAHGLVYMLFSGLPPATSLYDYWLSRVGDAQLLKGHIAVYDLKSWKLRNRIYLPRISAQVMELAPDGRILVGYEDLTNQAPVPAFSVVDPLRNLVTEVPSLPNPVGLRVEGNELYVVGKQHKAVDIFALPTLAHLARITLPAVPSVPPQGG